MLLSTHNDLVLISLSLLISTVLGVHSKRRPSYAVKETHHVPQQWTRVGPAPAWHMINLQIGLKQGRFSELEKHLYEGNCTADWLYIGHVSEACVWHLQFLFSKSWCWIVSDPTHPRYGQHLTGDEVNQLIQPTNETIDQIHEWLLCNNISQSQLEYTPARDWISITLPVESVEKLLDTKYSIFQHKGGSQIARATQWSLPTHLHKHVETIQPTTSFFRPQPQRSTLKPVSHDDSVDQLHVALLDSPERSTASKACNTTAVTSLCLRTLYGMFCLPGVTNV